MLIRLCCLLLIGLLAAPAHAGELHLIVSGTAQHAGDNDFNEENWGLGFEYDLEMRNNWIPFYTGASFLDSNDNVSHYLGGGAKRRFLLGRDPDGLHLDAGVVGFLMVRKGYKSGDPFPGALPFISFGNKYLALNVTYVPQVDPKMVEFFYFQGMFRLLEF
jgi:hypothetical protein